MSKKLKDVTTTVKANRKAILRRVSVIGVSILTITVVAALYKARVPEVVEIVDAVAE